MAVKTITITIDMDAYETLARHKRPGQSFSQVIKERLGSRRTGRGLAFALRHARVGGKTIAALDAVERARQADRPRRVKL